MWKNNEKTAGNFQDILESSRRAFPSGRQALSGGLRGARNGNQRELTAAEATEAVEAVEVPLGCFVLDAQGRVTQANESGIGLLSRARMLGRGGLRLAACVHPADRRRFRAFLRSALRGQRTEPTEFWLQRRRAAPSCMQLVAAPHPDGCTVAALDVTRRKLGELALRRRNEELTRELGETEEQLREGLVAVGKRERQLSEIFNSALDAIILLSADGRIVRFNPAAERMFGWPADRVAGQPITVLVPQRLRLAIRQDLRRAAIHGCVHIASLPPRMAMRADGTEFPVEASFARTGDGAGASTVAFIRDVSERVEALQGMVENWRALTDFFDAAPLGLLWLRPDGEVERVNDAELEILARPRAEVLGHRLDDFHVEGAGIGELLRGVAAGETLRNLRFQVRRPDGSLRHVLIDANGSWRQRSLTHCRFYVRDITPRVDLEREVLAIAEREQERIGHELHDDLCQQLTALEFLSESLAGRVAGTNPRVTRGLREISSLLRSASRQTREIARGLSQQAVFHRGGLAAALQDFAQRIRKVYHCRCRFTNGTNVVIADPVVCTNLFRIAQESVTNALRHGRATRIDLALREAGGDLVLEVGNNGRPLREKPSDGMGLRIMRYRAGVVGGRLELVSRPRGLAVICTVTDAVTAARGRAPASR